MFRVSCIQLRSNNNIHYNLDKTSKLIIKAVKQKTDFIITPEVSSHFSLNKKELLKIYNDTYKTYPNDECVYFLHLLILGSIFLYIRNPYQSFLIGSMD